MTPQPPSRQPARPSRSARSTTSPASATSDPAEIARRRRAGHIGLVAAVALFAVLVLIGAPPLARLLIAIPAVISASGYLQAYFKFCAGFGARGVFNFDEVGTTNTVARRGVAGARPREGEADRYRQLRDRAVAGVVAVLLPI